MVDAADLKSAGWQRPCRFKSGPGHQLVRSRLNKNKLGDLETLAQLSVGLIGFAGVVSALSKSRLHVNTRTFRIRALLLYSTAALFGSLLPIVLASFDLSSTMVWVASSSVLTLALAGIFVWLGVIVRRLTSEGHLSNALAKSLRGVAIIVIVLFIWGIVFLRAYLHSIYLVGLLWTLGMGVFHFYKLVMSIQLHDDGT